jgi:hypothetical protein
VQSVRIAALDCLSSFIDLPFYKIFPYQKKSTPHIFARTRHGREGFSHSCMLIAVTNELLSALDDPKRAVRRAAVRCRNQWYVHPSGRARNGTCFNLAGICTHA